PTTGAVTTPIYQTSTYVQEAVGVHKGYDYARVANPTRTALQIALASLENGAHGIAFSSGLGATTTLMHLVDPGDRVVLIADVYGGVYRMTSQVYEPKGYAFTYVPANEFDDNLSSYLGEDVKLVWVETPSNPVLNVVDIRKAAAAAHAVRMRQHCENARRVAEFLDGHPGVERVLYPGLPNHPGHDVARKQMRDFGGMVSFLTETDQEAVELVARTQIFKLAESLGGVESLIEHPARMTHASTASAPFAPPGNLVRLSVGIEAVDDLVADLEQALVRSAAAART